MTVDQLVDDLRLFPRDALVVFESARAIVLVTGVSANRVHVADGVARHRAENCAGCARQIALVAAVSLLGQESGGGR